MMGRNPRQFPLKYLWPGIPTLLALCFYATDQYLSQLPWWPKVPWLWVAVAGFVFVAGSAYADLLNPGSKLRKWIGQFKTIFVIDGARAVTRIKEGLEWGELVINVRFIRAATDVYFFVRVHACHNLNHAKQTFIIKQHTYDQVEKDFCLELVLATFPIREGDKIHSSWGSRVKRGPDTGSTFHMEAEHLVEIGARSKRGTEIRKVLVAGTDPRTRLFVAREDDSVIKVTVE